MATYFMSMTFEDSEHRHKRLTRKMTATDATQAAIDEATVVAAFNAMSQSQIVKSTLTTETVYSPTIPETANVDAGARFTTDLVGKTKSAYTRTIDPIKSIIQPGGSINLSDPLVTAIRDLFVSGGELYLSDGEIITEFTAGIWDR